MFPSLILEVLLTQLLVKNILEIYAPLIIKMRLKDSLKSTFNRVNEMLVAIKKECIINKSC